MAIKSEPGLVLDTHVWVWLSNGNKELSSSCISRIEQAAVSGQVYIPAIAVWEVATLTAKGRLNFNMPLKQWVEEALSKPGINVIPLLPIIAVESAELPGDFHGDPADRLIVATARIKCLPLMTRDAKILNYSASGNVVTIKA